MAGLVGRQRWLCSARPASEAVEAGLFGAVAVLFAVMAVRLRSPGLAVIAGVVLVFAGYMTARVAWTRRHPDVTRAVTVRVNAQVRAHPMRTKTTSLLAGTAVGPMLVWQNTPRGHVAPWWSWPAAAVAGAALGYIVGRARLRRAFGSQF